MEVAKMSVRFEAVPPNVEYDHRQGAQRHGIRETCYGAWHLCRWGGGENIFLALYVDDLLIVWSSKESLTEVKERLKDHFKMKDMGSAHFLFGVEIRRKLDGGY